MNLDKKIRKVYDFPKSGILFYDITSVIYDCEAMKYIEDRMFEKYRGLKIDKIVAIDSRGFIFAPLLARRLKIPVVLCRKKGKLPNETYSQEYELEYGRDAIEIQKVDLKARENILIVDDLIATGGTVLATKNIIEKAGAKCQHLFCVIALPFLNYQEKLGEMEVSYLQSYHSE